MFRIVLDIPSVDGDSIVASVRMNVFAVLRHGNDEIHTNKVLARRYGAVVADR